MSALFKAGFIFHRTFDVTHSVFSCFFLLPLCWHTHLPNWRQLPVWKNQKGREEALSWGLRWKRIPFGWTAGGSTCRPQSYTVCRSKRLREGRGASKMFSAQTHMHACSHTHPVCTYIIITRGGALQNVRIADSYCNRDDFKRNSNIGMIQSWHPAVSVKTLNCCSPGQSMRILPGWFTEAGTWL